MPSYDYSDDVTFSGITQQQAQQIVQVGTGALPADTQITFEPTPVQPTTTSPTYNPNYATTAQPTATTSVANPSWMFAVNMPSTYPDFAAMKAAGTGIVIELYDPNFNMLMDAARAWGVPVSIQVNAPNGITPQDYAARVAQAQTYNPDHLVLDIESVGKGYEGSAGWNWSAQTAALLKPIVGDTAVAVTMEPNQDDYNYGAYQNLSTAGPTNYWVQSYLGDMTPVDAQAAIDRLVQNGVDASQVTAVLAPGAAPTAGVGTYASYGIPTTGASVAGIYGGNTPVGIPTPGAVTTTYPGSPTSGGAGATTYPVNPTYAPKPGPDYAAAYFGSLGLPADVQKAVNDLFKKYPDQPELAIALAKQYIRTTPWFAQTFPGFFEGLRAGLFTDETGYRGYVNAANVYTQQYFGRPITTAEVESAMHQGFSPEYLGKTYEAQAISKANGSEIQYLLGAFGDENLNKDQAVQEFGKAQAGIGGAMGARVMAAVDRANKRMQTLFRGELAVPNTAGQALAPPNVRDLPA